MFMWNFHGHFGLYAKVKLNSMLGGSDWLGLFFFYKLVMICKINSSCYPFAREGK